jgi:hypothetical protein
MAASILPGRRVYDASETLEREKKIQVTMPGVGCPLCPNQGSKGFDDLVKHVRSHLGDLLFASQYALLPSFLIQAVEDSFVFSYVPSI